LGGGGLWGAKSFEALFQGIFTALGFLKVLENSSMFNVSKSINMELYAVL
jgi:hypothetical protein